MSYRNSARPTTPRSASSMMIGILIGIVLGLATAGGVALYIQNSPDKFLNQEQAVPEKTLPQVATPASAVGESKPRFEFYKVLTDKQDGSSSGQKGVEKPTGTGTKSVSDSTEEIYFLQAGSFTNAEDADKLKAKLALLGMVANVQTAIIPDKGAMHRVRLGPYKGADEMNKARASLKLNGMAATPMRAQ